MSLAFGDVIVHTYGWSKNRREWLRWVGSDLTNERTPITQTNTAKRSQATHRTQRKFHHDIFFSRWQLSITVILLWMGGKNVKQLDWGVFIDKTLRV